MKRDDASVRASTYKSTRPKPRKQPEHLAIRDPFKRAMLRRLDALAEAVDRNTAAINQLHERICVFVQRPAVPVERRPARVTSVMGDGERPPWLDDNNEKKESPDAD